MIWSVGSERTWCPLAPRGVSRVGSAPAMGLCQLFPTSILSQPLCTGSFRFSTQRRSTFRLPRAALSVWVPLWGSRLALWEAPEKGSLLPSIPANSRTPVSLCPQGTAGIWELWGNADLSLAGLGVLELPAGLTGGQVTPQLAGPGTHLEWEGSKLPKL